MNRALLKGIGAIALICGLGFPAYAETYGDFEYRIEGRSVTITEYTGSAARVTIPENINGLPVAGIDGYSPWIGGFAGAFDRCENLISVTIPASVAFIRERAFDSCDSLTSITVDGRNPAYSSYNGVLFDKQMRILIRYPRGKSESSYTIPGSVTAIGAGAFAYCRNLTSITIPASLASIGQADFDLCDNLTSITVDGLNPAYSSYNGVLFDKQMRMLIRYPKGKSESSYTVPGSVTAIGDRAFAGCNNLTSVTIPASLASIGPDAFVLCYNLDAIAADGRNPVYSSYNGVLFDKQMRTLIRYPEGKRESSYTVPSSVIAIGDRAFDICRNLTSITIPNSVVSIGRGAFSGCMMLTSVTIPASLASIEAGAFAWCDSLNPAVRADIEKRFGIGVFYHAMPAPTPVFF